MNGRQANRRMVLKGFLGAMGLLATRSGAARAEVKTDFGYGSKEDFKESCEGAETDGNKGEFIDSPQDKLTICVHGDGSKTTCDQKGNNCTFTDPPKRTIPVGWDLPILETLAQPTLIEDPGAAASQGGLGDALKNNDGPGGKRRKRGRRRKK